MFQINLFLSELILNIKCEHFDLSIWILKNMATFLDKYICKEADEDCTFNNS